ncbi:baseplate wedge subunit tail pin [Pectobacterium phage POP12]|nr:baseplate wedge subunit tail pin [Pectobacterium phage POP12]
MISKTREGAKVPSREANYLQFNPDNKLPDIGGKRAIGGVNVDQTRLGVLYPNIQSAIDDLYSQIHQVPVNAVISLTVDQPPVAVQQVESITFSGSVSSTEFEATKEVIHVYGYPFMFPLNTNASTICETVYNFFNTLVASEQVFDFVARKGANGDILEVRFIDCLPHERTDSTEHGVTMSGNIDVQAQSGYGTWSKLGTTDLAVTPPVPLYHFKRIA